ncbi:serine hydrolase domain-containing protein [Fluviispira multicolorata]|uniref:Serine hydrolase n=1 Tax=Fluviispira multicolorata TaxID=2654512 RepID=A0A833JBZ7_9BACT|nr:serine hydrolase domain-containing protein [Fluviispira multicolorata]KAB8029893.1 serine hydrolase [Fluviispira multicolorata]
MLKFLLSVTYFLCFSINLLSHAFSTNFSKEANESIHWASEVYQLPSIWLSVSLAGQNEHYNYLTGGYIKGDDKKINEKALYKVSGLTKTVTAEIINKLILEKKIKLNDKIGKWFPEYPLWGKASIKDLLNNTSGILDYTKSFRWNENLIKNPTKIWNRKDLLDIPYDGSILFEPGTQWENSNTNYLLLGIIIEKVTNKSLSEFYNTIISGSDMKNSYYIPAAMPDDIISNLIHGYTRDQIDIAKLNASWALSVGGLYSNPHDMIKWFETLLFSKITLFKNSQNPQFENPFISLTTTKSLKRFDSIGFSSALYSMPTSNGILWFNAGYFPGYLSFAGIFPCSGIIFAYSTSRVPKKMNLQEIILQKLLKSIEKDEILKEKIMKYKTENQLPAFCKSEPKNEKFIFPDEIRNLY